MPQNDQFGRRLDSWKEIAAYLHRDIRTAIRWGKERGLPVHRVPGGKRHAVFAYPREIDAWMGSHGTGNGSSNDISNGLTNGISGNNGHSDESATRGLASSADGPLGRPENGDHSEQSIASVPGSHLTARGRPEPSNTNLRIKRSMQSQAAARQQDRGGAQGLESPSDSSARGDGAIPSDAVISTSPAAHPAWLGMAKGKYGLVVLVLAGIIATGWLTEVLMARSNAPATIRPLSFKKLMDDGHSKGGSLRTDGDNIYFIQTEGSKGVLMSAPLRGGPIRPISTPFSNVALEDLSSDGQTLLIISYEGIIVEGTLWTLPVQGGTPHRIGDVQCSFARWSPDNRRIACSGRTTITLMDADGANSHTIASSSMPISQITWTPDGNNLRYVVNNTAAHTCSQSEIPVTANEPATAAREISQGPGCLLDWTWTRDGKLFFYTEQDEGGKTHLMVQPENSSRPTELQVDIGRVWPLVPAKTGNTLYLGMSGATRSELLKFNVRQQSFETLLPGLSASFLAFSPDGQWITYTISGGGSLWRSRVDGSHAIQLADLSMDVEVSSWSPDGKRIAFMGRKPGQPFRIYLVDRDGGQMEEASEGDDNQGGPSWSADGKSIVYGNVFCERTQNCWIRRLDMASRKTEIVPGSNGLRTARYSPDGKFVAALRFQTRDLMLFDVKTQKWRVLANSVAGDNINWASDSQYVFVDSPRDMKPVVERVRVKDGHRNTVVSLARLRNLSGSIDTWMGLAPDNSPIIAHLFSTSDLYELKWTDK